MSSVERKIITDEEFARSAYFQRRALRVNGRVVAAENAVWHRDIARVAGADEFAERGFIGWNGRFYTDAQFERKVSEYERSNGYAHWPQHVIFE